MSEKLEELRKRRMEIEKNSDSLLQDMDSIIQENLRVADVANNAEIIIKNLDEEFEAQTELRGKDISFLFFATALQCVRQYFLTDFKE